MPLSVAPSSSTAKDPLLTSTVKNKSPAFQGASRAFNANIAAPAGTFNGANGALAAASWAGGGGRGQIQTYSNEGLSVLSRQNTGQSSQPRNPSPSHVAASLAASQALHRPSHGGESSFAHQQSLRRSSSLQRMPTGPSATDGQKEDIPSPATKSLVQLYESKQDPPLRKTQSVRYGSKPGPPIRSPKPVRPPARSVSSASTISNKLQAPLVGTRPIVPQNESDVSRHRAAVPTLKRVDSVFETIIDTHKVQAATRESPQALQPRKNKHPCGEDGTAKMDSKPMRARSSTATPALVDGIVQGSREDVSRDMKTMPGVYSYPQPSSSSESKSRSQHKPSPYPARPPILSAKSFDKIPPPPLPRQISREHTRQLSTHMSVDSLANAMVASSLASSRVPSPTKSVPLPPPPRRHHFFHRNQSQELISRTPSPAKPMRHTMRRPPESDDETDGYKKGKGHLVRKHQHKHHEGDRKRYRTQVTERERKRYEGVWAANRGLLFSPESDPTTSTNAVLNTVVKDIWRRSRLPDDVLEEVWDLAVSSQDTDRLGREEFVVGLWLIDQRLKGNKLPIKVSESLWASTRRLPGIKVPENKALTRM